MALEAPELVASCHCGRSRITIARTPRNATHWTSLSEPPHKRMGVNANLFEPGAMKAVAVRKVNGRSWKR